jgi:hypothetical protein
VWRVLGQQVLMGRMNVPLPLLTATPVGVNEGPATFAAVWQQHVGPVVYANTHQRGYLAVTARRSEMHAEWWYVDGILARSAGATLRRTLRTLPVPMDSG